MRYFFILGLSIFLFAPIDANAQQTQNTKSVARAPHKLEGYIQAQIKTDETYLALVDRTIKNPSKTDWTKLRQLYPDTSFYEAAGGKNLASLAKEMETLVRKENSPATLYAFKTYLREHYASMGAHEAALRLAKELNIKDIDAVRSNYALRTMINNVVRPVDGLSPEKAYKIISFEEMETVLRLYFKLSDLKEPTIKIIDKQPYALYEITDYTTKKTDTYYFLIDARMMGHEGEKKIAKLAQADTPKELGEQDKNYIILVKAAVDKPTTADWATIRNAYSQSSFYHPYIGDDLWGALTKAAEAVRDKGDKKSVQHYAAIYQTHFGHYRAQQHVVQFHASHKLGFLKIDTAKIAADQLIKALMRTGDGRSPETAFKIVDIGEETLILQAIKAQFRKRDLTEINGSYYDIYDLLNVRDGKAAMYFNIDKLIKTKD